MFVLGSFVAAVVTQELWRGVRARRAMSGDNVPRAFVNLIARNRRRYGGYLVHLGISVLFVGVAASSAFQKARDVELNPGQVAAVGGYEFALRRADRRGDSGPERPPRAHRPRCARRSCSKNGKDLGTLVTKRSFFPTNDPNLGPVSRYFEGNATSEVALRAGAWRDVWVVVAPDTGRLRPRIEQADAGYTALGDLPADARSFALAKVVVALSDAYATIRRRRPSASSSRRW